MHGARPVWLTKIERYTRLSEAEAQFVIAIENGADRRVEPRTDIFHEGETPRALHLIVEGWAVRYKMLGDGRRQIVDFLLPGCISDLNAHLLRRYDHSLGSLTAVRYAEIAPDWVARTGAAHPRILRALEWEALVVAAVQREWTVNLGQRTATERVAHLMCELFYRLRSVGLAAGNACVIPLTQLDLAEATGMTAVHVNRTLQNLRSRGVLRWNGGRLEIPDLAALESVALFNPDYLHLDREGRHFDAAVSEPELLSS